MADTQSGLDSLDNSSDEQVVPGTVKPTASKGAYSLGTPTGPSGYDPDLLANMQQMIDERQAKKNSFMEGMKDAMAWWSGGVAGPAEALQNRALEREREDQELFGMKRDLSQAKVGLMMAKSMDNQLFGNPATAGSSNTLPPSHIDAGAPTQSSSMVQQGGILGLVKDKDLRESIAAQAQRGDRNGAFKAVQDYLAKNATNTDMIKDLNYMVNNGLIDPKLVPAAALTKFVGSGAFVPHDVRGIGGTGQGTPFGAATGVAGVGGNPGAIPGAPQGAAMPQGAPPAARPVVAPQQAPQQAPQGGGTMPAAPVKPVAPSSFPAPLQPAQTTTPTQLPRVASPFTPGSKEDLEYQAKNADVGLAGKTKEAEKFGESSGDNYKAMTELALQAPTAIKNAQLVQSVANDSPNIFNVQSTPQYGINKSIAKKVLGLSDAEAERYAKKQTIGEKDFNKVDVVESAAKTLAIQTARTAFGSTRMGIGLENLMQKAKGVGTDLTAESNKFYGKAMEEAAKLAQQMPQLFNQYKAAHPGSSYNDFLASDDYKKVEELPLQSLSRQFPEYFSVNATKEAKSKYAYDDAAKEAAYQEYLKNRTK
jgi:hypothetical protein